MKHFKATWGKALHIISWCTTALFVALPVTLFLQPHPHPGQTGLRLIGLLLLLLLLGCLLLTVRGYAITPGTLLIHRLLWKTRIDLAYFRSATPDPEAFKGALRIFGNGGLFSFTGFYWSKRLGLFRAYASCLHHCVVLRFTGRKVVVSPDDPADFVRELTSDKATSNKS